MKTDNAILRIQQAIGGQGTGLSRVLGLILLIAPMSAALADTDVTGVRHTTDNGDVTLVLDTEGDEPSVSVFATESPPRVIMDLANTDSQVSATPVSVGAGGVRAYTTLASGGRTRVMVDLARPMSYDYQASDNQVTLTLSGGGAAAAASDSSGSSSAQYEVTGVDFRRGESGQGRVILSLDGEGASVAVNDRSGRVLVDVFNTSLPDEFSQRLDVGDFATPVQTIDVGRTNTGVRLDLGVSGIVEHLAYQSGNDVIVEVQEPERRVADEQPEVTFFEDKEYTGSRVTFNFQDIPVRSVLQLIADVSGLNIVVADNVSGNLTLRLTNVPWDQALDIILDARNLDMRENGNVIWIAPTADIAEREQQLLQAAMDRKELEPLITVLLDVSYADADALRTLIQESGTSIEGGSGLLSERGSVTIDERTNTLLVTDTAERIAEIRELVQDLDKAVRQVQIESRIVVANSDFAHDLGVRFGVNHLHDGNNILAISGDGAGADLLNPATNPRDDGLIDIPGIPDRYNVNLPVPDSSAATLGISFLTGDWLLDLELSALEAEGEGEVISTPRVITSNQNEAFIQQGVEIPYEESTSSGATSVQFKEAVLELRVTPLITPDNRVQLDLEIKQDTVGEIFQTGRGGSVPSIDTRELATSVLVNNGETIVLGGIFQDERTRSKDQVPFLGDIPGLGYLFKRKSTETRKRELLIFVTPSIVEDRPVVAY